MINLPDTLRSVIHITLAIFLFVPLQAQSNNSIHELFDEVLQKHVVDGQVNYPGIAADPQFKEYIQKLATTSPPESKNGALAYWINAYNALTIQGILEGRSPSTFFGRIGFFKNAKYNVNNSRIDLYDLEHDILIKLGDPRIHFAIVCASTSCPLLRSEAYAEDRLNRQLEEGARRFINDEVRNQFDREKMAAQLSKIFDWFAEDFENQAGSVLRYIAHYVGDSELAIALEKEDYTIEYLDYDWSLNGTPPTK